MCRRGSGVDRTICSRSALAICRGGGYRRSRFGLSAYSRWVRTPTERGSILDNNALAEGTAGVDIIVLLAAPFSATRDHRFSSELFCKYGRTLMVLDAPRAAGNAHVMVVL